LVDGTRIATHMVQGAGTKGTVKAESEVVKQCAVMFVNPGRERTPHPEAMRAMGFVVHEITDWPANGGAVRDYHVVIVGMKDVDAAPMLAARLRAKPHFGRRLLIALVPAGTPPSNRRAAEASGFDDVVNECCDTRHLTTRILRGLRTRPELRCVLPPPERRRSAA
jgi:hypothetical protein